MSNSYRIRTKLGVNQSINVQLEQDFEFLEILSLKITQSQIYTRQCSDYGVIVGRITANDGFGIPNARLSVFIPLSDQDENNPIISDLYPYRSLTTINDDGFRYNLLPKTQSHSGHVPVGSFFDKEDVLVNPNYIEVFDKYFKFTTITNDSGDYMIFGVPIGSQTIHVDVDLSDIGEFSLAPQDLIRMGIATEAQVAGNKFRKSTNLNELPQIISFNRTLEVVPLWGQPEICSLGITRTDFDLASEANVTITPTAIFMGSIFSTNDKDYQRKNCKPKSKQGELCNLVTGPGEILAIRQTIFEDDLGRPILETFDLESGGQVIDENGAWLVDIPMNLDYVITNEFGDRVLSNDPKKGIPTKGKYRFKIKWNQSPKLSESIKRGYFLVPNVREYGWDYPNTDPLSSSSNSGYNDAVKSYAFSVDWNDYGDTGTTIGLRMIQTAIDCEDKFYPMIYNKVYSISQLIDQYRNGYLPDRIISVKNILDDSCESENVRFPTNDTFFRFDLIYLLFIILIFIARPILFIFLHVAHFLAWIMKTFGISGWRKIAFMQIPNLTFPECDLCECEEGKTSTGPGPSAAETNVATNLSENAYITPLTQFTNFNGPDTENSNFAIQQLFSGNIETSPDPHNLAPQLEIVEQVDVKTFKAWTNSLPTFERINLFNVKAKYFDWDGYNNPGGGQNRIKVNFRPTENGYPTGQNPQQYGIDFLNVVVDTGNINYTNDVPIVNLSNQTYIPPLAPTNPFDTSTHKYTAPLTSNYTITLTVEIVNPNNDLNNAIGGFFFVQKNNQTIPGGNILVSNVTNSGSGIPLVQTFTITQQLNQNDLISVTFLRQAIFGSGSVNCNVKLEVVGNNLNISSSNLKYHLDNVMMLMVKPDKLSELRAGTILSFQNPEASSDVNITGYTQLNQFGLPSTTGTTINPGQTQISVLYANPNGYSGDWYGPGGSGGDSHYIITQGTNDAQYNKFSIDIEYFQVITAMTWQNFSNLCNTQNDPVNTSTNTFINEPFAGYQTNSLQRRFLDSQMFYHVVNQTNKQWNVSPRRWYPKNVWAFRNFDDYQNQIIVFMVRGVDPNSTRGEVEYDLSRLFGYPLDNLGRPNGPIRVRGTNYKLNIPIRGKLAAVRHDYPNGDITIADTHTNQDLYYPSYHYLPSNVGDAKFTGFTSNFPSYYSSLGTNTPTNYLQGARDFNDVVTNGTLGTSSTLGEYLMCADSLTWNGGNWVNSGGYLVRNLRNGFNSTWIEWEDILFGDDRYVPARPASNANNPNIRTLQVQGPNTPPFPFYTWPVNGYYLLEIIDGGSFMNQLMEVADEFGPDLKAEAWYYSPSYPKTNSYNYANVVTNNKIIMRSDRLPTSTNTLDSLQNSYAWQANANFGVFIISDDGSFVVGSGLRVGSPTFNTNLQTIEENNLEVLDSFNCQSLVPLDCYFVPQNGNEIDIRNTGDPCYENGVDNELIMKNGCYVFITAPFDSLSKDLRLLWEWTSRIQINFAACRNVFSHIFTNNWINGSLYAFSFQNERLFDNQNQPFSNYCKDTIFLHPSNNFYYRSSPFKYVNVSSGNTTIQVTSFIGSPDPQPSSILGFTLPSYGGNLRLLKTPTTMVDLGPRNQYLQELVFSNDFDGYMVNRLRETSFQDVSELLNLLIINRLTNQNVINSFRNQTAVNILFFFDKRKLLFIDGDYAQAISINSELGVIELNSINYPPIGGPSDQDPIFFSNPLSIDPVIGIFFSSNTQTRDFFSPRRTILNPNLPIGSNTTCSFDNIGVFSQEVPFYQWERFDGELPNSIFGAQKNDWFTNYFSQYYNDDNNLSYLSFFKYRYQSLDRLFKQSRYYRPSSYGNPNNGDFKGYIFSIDRNPQSPPLLTPEYEAIYRLQAQPNDPLENIYQVGAPFFFYFGLKKGKTAFDRFAKKWLDFNNIVE